MFTEVVREISGSRAPVYKEHILIDTVTDPIKLHVDRFCSFLFEVGVCKADGRRIVDLDRGGWLCMSHFLEADAEGGGIFGGKEGGANFRLCSGAHYVLHYFVKNMDDSITEGNGRL